MSAPRSAATSRSPRRAVAAALLLAAAGQVHADSNAAKVAGPQPGPAREVRFPAFEEQTLPNGLRVVVVQQHEQPLVSLQLLVKAGKSFEPAGKQGLAKATAALLTQGTATRAAQQVAAAIDFVGGTLSTGASVEAGFASIATTSDQLDLAFELLADVILHPSFPQDEIDRWRKQTLDGLRIKSKTAGYLANTAFLRTLFGEHPYGRPADGTAESLAALSREDFVAFHRERYVAGQALIAVVGDVTPADAFARVRRAFAGWAQGTPVEVPAVSTAASSARRILVIDKPDAAQTEIRLGQTAIAFRDPDLYVAEVYNSLVGKSSSARLNEELRVRRGLTYGASSSFTEPSQPGWFVASTSTKTASTVTAVTVALDVLGGLSTEAVPAAELASAKTFITGALPLEIETAAGTAGKVLEAMRAGYGRDFLEHYNEHLSGVTAVDLQRFARERMHPDTMTVVLVGNAAAFAQELREKLGAFETVPAAKLDFLRSDLRTAETDPAPPPH